MTFAELKVLIHNRLQLLYPKSEINSFYFILLQHYANCSTADVLADENTLLLDNITQSIQQAITELQTAKPIQYILGETEFFSNRFFVDENVLIPRPETEELVDWVLHTYPDKTLPLHILDIGTGSGCIAVSLAKALPEAQVTAIDVSPKAIAVAQRNAKRNGTKIEFLQCDILQTKTLPQKYDVIISNPPYVRELEKSEMHNNVLSYEPHLALFVPNEHPLLFYEQIATLAQQYLTPKGTLFFEINQYLATEMQEMLTKKNFTQITIRQDLSGNDRMLCARYPS
ncbi:peptide chain release factor N(5)-glutamine methyltransferase [uncultured Capnocytophaga sp.]|uniref:peptide chain release factor N(5)-glutamine methyltransferase n=1 Tax=uncultured Capnocytophaga sp. TaxID=159273 RepID=UPI002610844A|nr:peptide chain release factor N(5)-glutamine methyltransferase [uncultured Capnocytophaga sp.]